MIKYLIHLIWFIGILNKYNITYHISGGFAAHTYGSDRDINDIDVDIKEEDYDLIVDDVKDYIIEYPHQHKNERWDLKVMLLNHNGQEIDIGGAKNQKIFDDTTGKRNPFPSNFEKSLTVNINGNNFKVIHPEDLVKYKALLSGDHQKKDIKAVNDFININIKPTNA